MKKEIVVPVLMFSSLMLSACSDIYEPKPHIMSVDNGTVISNTASLSHIISYDFSKDYHSCTHPAPDAAFDQGEASDFSVTLISVGNESDAGGESENSQEVEMAGRTPAVLIAREMFYRLCEFSKNQKLDKTDAKDLYVKTLDVIKDVWTIEAGKTNITIGQTLTDTLTSNFAPLPLSELPVTNVAPTN